MVVLAYVIFPKKREEGMLAGVNPGPRQSRAEVSAHLLKCSFVLYFFHGNHKDVNG